MKIIKLGILGVMFLGVFFISQQMVFAAKINVDNNPATLQENADSKTFTVTLDEPIITSGEQPAYVTINLTTNDNRLILSTSSVTFTASEWAMGKQFVVTTVGDSVSHDDNNSPHITLTAVSNSEYYSGFTTNVPITLLDSDPFFVVSTSPVASSTNVVSNQKIVITFSTSTATLLTSSSPCGEDGCPAFTTVMSASNTVATLTKTSDWTPNTTYTIQITATSSDNVPMDSYTLSFTTLPVGAAWILTPVTPVPSTVTGTTTVTYGFSASGSGNSAVQADTCGGSSVREFTPLGVNNQFILSNLSAGNTYDCHFYVSTQGFYQLFQSNHLELGPVTVLTPASHHSGGSTIQSRVANLMEMGNVSEANALIQQYSNQFSTSTISSTSTPTAVSTSTPFIFTHDLKLGMSGKDVSALQQILINKQNHWRKSRHRLPDRSYYEG